MESQQDDVMLINNKDETPSQDALCKLGQPSREGEFKTNDSEMDIHSGQNEQIVKMQTDKIDKENSISECYKDVGISESDKTPARDLSIVCNMTGNVELSERQDSTQGDLSKGAECMEEQLMKVECESERDGVVQNVDVPAASEELHMHNLGKICRICAKMKVFFDGPKRGVPKSEIIKHVKKVWNVDLSEEDSDIYPVNCCQYCERKIKRLYLKVAKKKKCELYIDKPAEFVAHSEVNCVVCSLKESEPLDIDNNTPDTNHQEDANGNGPPEGVEEEAKFVKNSKFITEPRRNPARKRGWGDNEPSSSVSVGCQTEPNTTSDTIPGLEEHDYIQEEDLTQFLVIPKKSGGRSPYNKQSLSNVNAKYIRQDRLRPLIAHIDKFCQMHKEDKVEAMFFLLMEALRDAGDREREAQVEDIWCRRNTIGMSLTDEECLAKRILLKQTKDQYRKEYSYYKEKLEKPVLKPPFIIDKLEKTYFPEYLDYFVTDGETGPIIHNNEKHTVASYFPISGTPNAGGKVDSNYSDIVVGVRWHYFNAVAKTLEELAHSLESTILDLDEDARIQVDLYDYFEEKRDLTNFGEKSDSSAGSRGGLHSKLITYNFGIEALHAISTNKKNPIYQAVSNAVQFRPLMKALVTEGNNLRPTLRRIEEERAAMTEKYFHITLPGGTPLRFIIYFANSSPEFRKDYRNMSGLTLSSFKKAPAVINRYGSLCLELKRSWLASSPRLIHVCRLTNCRIKCSRCGEQGHNVRKCVAKSDGMAGEATTQHKKRKKQRSVPGRSCPVIVNHNNTPQMFGRDSKVVYLCEQTPEHQADQETQNPLNIISTGTNIDQNSVIRDDEILWTCPGIENTSQQLTGSNGTQVLIPSSVVSSTDYQTGQHRSQPQISQVNTAPVYVWTYTVVQPEQNSSQQSGQPVSLIHQQNSQQTQPLPVIHQPGVAQDPLTVVQQGGASQPSVVHQQVVREHTAQQTHHLSVIHQQNVQPSTAHQQQVVPHQQQPRRSSQETLPQHLTLIQPQANQPQPLQQAQPLTLVQQHQPTSQPQTPQQVNIIHPGPTGQQITVVHQHQGPQAPSSVGTPTQSDVSQTSQRLVHNQTSELQPIIGQW